MTLPVKRSRQATEFRQGSLVDAALQLAAQRSPADITTGDLALAVGISQGAVFRHFPSKEAIWLAVLDWTADTLIAQLRLAASQSVNPLMALQAVFMAHVDFVMDHPGVPRVIFQELQHAQDTALKARVRGLMQQHRALVAGLLQRAQEQNLLEPGTDVAAAAVLFLGSVQGLVMQAMVSGQVQAMAAQAPGVFSIYLRGISAPNPTESRP
ncbi:MAG: TetR family transcriptional regulator [Rhodoferax sp.]